MPRPRAFEYRFGVGEPNGPRSSIWKVWAGRNQPDLYLAARSYKGAFKVSFHEKTGERHAAIPSEFFQKQNTENENGPKSRILDQWNNGMALAPGLTLEYQLVFPTSQLRALGKQDIDRRKPVEWIDAAPAGQAVNVSLFLGPRRESHGWPGKNAMGNTLLAQGALVDGRTIWLVYLNVKAPSADQEIEYRKSLRDQLQSRDVDLCALQQNITPTHRLHVGYFDTFHNCPCCVEWAADTLFLDSAA